MTVSGADNSDAEAGRIIQETFSRAPLNMAGEPLFPAATDLALQPPEHIPEWLIGYRWNNADEVATALADVTGESRELRWQQADICAAAWLMANDKRERWRVLGLLAEHMGCSRKTAERRVQLGLTYPPHLRAPDISQRVYLAALVAADPCEVMTAALERGWSARQVKEHIDTGQTPTARNVVMAEAFPQHVDPEEIADAVYRAICEAHAEAIEAGRTVLELQVRVVTIEQEYPERE